jgi:hypothetical protein
MGMEFVDARQRQRERSCGDNRAAQPEGCATKTGRDAVTEERQSGDWRSQEGQPIPQLRDLRMNRAVARFTSSAPTVSDA